MKLDATRFGIAAAGAAGLVWLAAGLVMLALPALMMGAAGTMMPGSMHSMGWGAAVTGIVVGAAVAAVLVGLTAWLTAILYNRLL